MSKISSDSGIPQYTQKLFADQQKEYADKLKDLTKKNADALSDAAYTQSQKLDKEVKKIKDTQDLLQEQSALRYQKTRDSDAYEMEKLKNALYDKNARGSVIPREEHLKRLKALEQLGEQKDEQYAKALKGLNQEKERSLDAIERKGAEAVKNLAKNYKQQVEGLQQQAHKAQQTAQDNNDAIKNKFQQSTHDLETDYKENIAHLGDAFDLEKGRLKVQLKDQQDRDSKRQAEVIAEAETRQSQILKKNQEASQQQIQKLRKFYNDKIAHLEKGLREDKRLSSDEVSDKIKTLSEKHQEALTKQVEESKKSLEQERKGYQNNLQLLEKTQKEHLKNAHTLANTEMEEKTRKTIVQEYEKTLKIERDRHHKALDQLLSKAKSPLADMQRTFEEQKKQLDRKFFDERLAQDRMHKENIADISLKSETKQQEQENQHQKEKEQIFKHFESLIKTQEHSFNELVQDLRKNYQDKITELQNKHNLITKEGQRKILNQQNDISRQIERKYHLQKHTHELQIQELKQQSQKKLQDVEKQGRKMLEEQQKMFETRINTMQEQFKEREMVLSQQFSDELERVRQSYEALGRTKG